MATPVGKFVKVVPFVVYCSRVYLLAVAVVRTS